MEISHHQQENRRLSVQVEQKKEHLRNLLAIKTNLAKELENLKSKE